MAALTTPRSIPVAPGRLPLLGHALVLARDPLRFFDSLAGCGEIVRVDLMTTSVYALTSPELVHRMLVTDSDRFDKGVFFEKIREFLGNGLASSEGTFHRDQRRLIQPAFHHGQIARYADDMSDLSVARAASWSPGQELDIKRELLDLSLDIVTRTLFSTIVDERTAAEIRHAVPAVVRGIYTRMLDPTDLWRKVPTPTNRALDAATTRLHQVIDQLVATRRADETEYTDLLSMLLNARDTKTGATMTMEQVHDELVTMLVAGAETSAGGLAWLMHELGHNLAADQALHTELREVLTGRDAGHQDLDDLPYTRRLVNESLRMRNPGGTPIRRARTEITLGGITFPKGTQFLYGASILHRNPRYFPDALRFDPDRWLPERASSVPRGAFLPFGAGAHMCIGNAFAVTEMMLATAAIASRWRLEPTGKPVQGVLTSTFAPRDLRMRVVPRLALA
ncbi:cytochrome P450 [Streptomyces noursei]|uniref:cytochrome P450 n=1 Tax=Streptomyces noursei TaxID=1971 RepID=UPI0033C5C812